ncbi:MAG: sigma-70 family RNA polymerase sigma factor [Flavobacteriales bacterium]|jgi:RNA polymerase sigma factor (sigma-70 family)|nr:sigma-70 family RNA polymerase sigma factor [Flavobacteriales bacterium]
MTDDQDKDLLKRFRDPSSRNMAFRELVNRYQERLYWHVRRIVIDHDDADDVLQNTFIKAFKNLDRFREDSQLFTWLYRIATNEALTFLKKKRKNIFVSLDDVSYALSSQLESDTEVSGDAIQLKLQQAILTLPTKQRLVFNMKYFDEMKYEEIAEVTGTSVGALKASYHHAVKKIEAFVKQQF